jgi:hypothetical protein
VVIRSIVDRAQDDMPVAITRAMRPDGTPRMGRMSAAVAGDPFLILTSARLAAQSRAASRSLAAFLVEYIPRLASTLDLTAI